MKDFSMKVKGNIDYNFFRSLKNIHFEELYLFSRYSSSSIVAVVVVYT